MNNRDKYIINVSSYDIMMQIKENTKECAVKAVGGKSIEKYNGEAKLRCAAFGSCSECIQNWLNSEGDKVSIFEEESTRIAEGVIEQLKERVKELEEKNHELEGKLERITILVEHYER